MLIYWWVINMVLKQLILQYESEHHINHKEMIKRIGIGKSTFFRWMNGESAVPKKTTMRRLSDLLGCDVEELLENKHRMKPILGSVKAGYNLVAEENIEGYVEVNQADEKKGDFFLRVQGDSMQGSHIFDGDLVYVEQCDSVSDGQIAVIVIGEEATIKKVRYKNDLMILEASNPKYESRYFTPEEVETLPVKIIGRVKFVRTDF